MNLTDEQYSILKSFANNFIRLDEEQGKEIKIETLNLYVERAVTLLQFQPDEETKNRLKTDLEYQHKIVHEKGHAIFDDYEDKHNWYSNMNVTNSFFWPRYKDYMREHTTISPRSINLLEDTTLPDILNCLGNPNEKFEGKRFVRGLVIGDVQSGKTATYTGLICKAADAGYKVVILLAGITESLRQQTQERIDEGIVGSSLKLDGKREIRKNVGVGLPIRATSFTSCVNDFVGNCDKITMSLNAHKSLVLFVIKKNVSVLRKLHDWLEEQNIDPITGYIDVPMLLIDDEADNASVNTKKDETDPTQTNKLIRQICHLFKNSTYVGFTATPFANIFIDPESVDSMKHADLFPKDFIYALQSPSNYVGASKIFYSDGMYHQNLRYITDIEEPDYTSDEYKEDSKFDIEKLNAGPFYYRHKKEWDGILPASLRESVLCFFITNVIRDLRGQKSAPRSMLVNMSRFVKVQVKITAHIEKIYNETYNNIRFSFSEDNGENTNLPLYIELQQIWKKHFTNVKDVTFPRVVKKKNLLNAIEKIVVLTVNGSKQSGKLDYKSNKSLRVIAVGGLALSRGLTLEGLIVSYFYRNTATFDVLMQMGRWFGYRSGYEDLFQIWTSKVSADWYAEVASASQELKDDIQNMREQYLTPKDFGIKVRDNCDELQITSSNKMRSASSIFMQYSFYGNIYDTPYITYNVEHNRINLEGVRKLTATLFENGYKFQYTNYKKATKDVKDLSDGSSRFFSDVPKATLIDFLRGIKCSMANPNFNVSNIIDFLSDEKNIGLEEWNIAFSGGDSDCNYPIEGLEMVHCIKRAVYHGNKNVIQLSARRRVLSGSSEGKYALSKDEIEYVEKIYNSKKNIPVRAFFENLPQRKPIFIIMMIDPQFDNINKLNEFKEELNGDKIVAFAIGCPGIKEVGKAVMYKVNKIYQRLNIEGDEPEEDEDEE
ncbi:Type III restriction enzyme, res subunit [Prevotella sp. khp1]|uniref:Z1 domain-containing protein n=1 Tax=Prevotellaceae TaxID=171552 RepID=UPI000887686C|nr:MULTISPECIES: Z1 domain-containing protein [Prevotellaceae]QVJ81401.1 Z1 domain-containing protein [Xylanibacter ruminicola]SDQ04012.1 Type III restriction enzyme, res subunit [Prevotella sp. khp1]